MSLIFFRFLSAMISVSALAWSQLAYAKLSPCDSLGVQVQNLYNASVQQGFTTLSQPIVVGCGNTGLTSDQAQAQSTAKVQQYQSWLASMQQLVTQNTGLSNCTYWQEANNMVNVVGVQQLQNLMSYNGSYCQAQTSITGSPASVANGFDLPLICRQDGTPANGLRPCSSVIADSQSMVKSFAQKIVDGVYRGCDISDPNLITAPDQCKILTQTPTCNYFDGITGIGNPVGSNEVTTNHLTRSCGNWTQFSTQISGRECETSNPSGQMGTLEQAYYQGNMVRALDCSMAQLTNEINQGKVTLTAPAGLDPKKLYATQLSTITAAQNSLLARKNISHIEDCGAVTSYGTASAPVGCGQCTLSGTVLTCMCQPTQGTSVSSTIDLAGCTQPPSVSNNNGVMTCPYASSGAIADDGSAGHESFQSSCQLYTQRTTLEQQVVYLGILDWVNRSTRAFERFDAGNDGVEFFAAFKNYFQQQAQASCIGHHGDCKPGTVLNQCYIPIWNSFFISRSNSVWNSGVCQ